MLMGLLFVGWAIYLLIKGIKSGDTDSYQWAAICFLFALNDFREMD